MKENIYTTGCKTVCGLWLAAVAVCVAVATCVESAVGLLLKIENNRFGGAVASVLMDGEIYQDAENGGTKAVLGKGRKTVAKRCVSLCSDAFYYTPELGGFKYRAAGLLAVA